MTALQSCLRGILVGLIVCMAGCAKAVPEPAGIPPGTPHVSWIIMYGDRDNPDTEFSCQSTGPRDCVLPASRPDQQVFSHVHFYYHGAGAQTTYQGTFRVEFLSAGSDDPPHDVPTSITVRGEEEIANQSVSGIVTSSPGRYAVRLVLRASMAGIAEPQSVREEIMVTVRAGQ